ncbi:zona occludens toxin (predicted ATPase), partial [Nocardioides sp. HB32]
MIEGFIGRPGSGKSYAMTAKALREADRDRLVFTNWAVKHPNVYMFTPDQLMDLPPGLVMIDEAHLWFPARMALKLPMSWLAGLSQTRKAGWDLVWAAQHETRVDRAVRDVTSWLWKCSAWFSYNQ